MLFLLPAGRPILIKEMQALSFKTQADMIACLLGEFVIHPNSNNTKPFATDINKAVRAKVFI